MLGSAPAAPFELGCVDHTVSDADCKAFIGGVEQLTERRLSEIKDGADKVVVNRLAPPASGMMTISQVQDALRYLGFFPGGEVDGIYGYRTTSAVRLFQEHVRTYEGQTITPDGRFGPQTQEHMQRWLQSGRRPDWKQRPGEYDTWLDLLNRVKQSYMADPTPFLQMVNAFGGRTNTVKVANWDFTGPGNIHLIGIRRNQFKNKFDDIFVLLIKGMVFKFQGSTEPGASQHPEGPPYLMPGQHNYRFGWHQSTYMALRPLPHGSLVLRAGNDRNLTVDDMRRGLQANTTINIHWAGMGIQRDVNSWSEGCQVINGGLYINPADQLIDCTSYAAVRSGEPQQKGGKTRGAYNVLLDLVTALSGDMPSGNLVKYMLLIEQDLQHAPELAQALDGARARVIAKAG